MANLIQRWLVEAAPNTRAAKAVHYDGSHCCADEQAWSRSSDIVRTNRCECYVSFSQRRLGLQVTESREAN